MNFSNTNFVMGSHATNSSNGTLEVSSTLLDNFGHHIIDEDKYKELKLKEKEFIFYKRFNLEFKKSLKIKFIKISLHIGDIIDFITRYTGIKKFIVWATNGNCGCEARRIKFNKWFFLPFLNINLENFNYSDYIDYDNQNKNPLKKKLYKSYKEYRKDKSNQEAMEVIHNVKNKNFERSALKVPEIGPTTTPTQKSSGCGCGAKKKSLTVTQKIV